MDIQDDFIPQIPIWNEPETGASGWIRQSYFLGGSEISMFLSPGDRSAPVFSARTAWSEHLAEFLFGLPPQIARKIAFRADLLGTRYVPWTKLPNQYWYAQQGSEVFIETKPVGYVIPCLRFFPFGSYSLIASDLTDEMAVELVAYISSRD